MGGGGDLIKQCVSQLAPAFEDDRNRGIIISTSHVEYGKDEILYYGADGHVERPYLLAVPVIFYRRIEEG